MYYCVLVASQGFHGREGLTYESAKRLQVGQVVAVPLQRKVVLGIVESEAAKPRFATKQVSGSWMVFVPAQSLELLSWLQDYYPAPLGLITELFTPPHLTKKLSDPSPLGPAKSVVKLPALTQEQAQAVKTVGAAKRQSVLLHGETGSGKTRVYVELAKQSLEQGKSVIVLTPEIGLTEPLLDTFAKTFGSRVLVTHSDMTPAQRRSVWLRSSRATEGLIIIGPRSALFSPLKSIGLIVMDEAHDSAYKQEQAPYYQTSRVAARLAHLHSAHFVMGSASPLISDYFAFEQKSLLIVRMAQPAIAHSQTTSLKLIDLRDKAQFSKSGWLASSLLEAISEALKSGEQSLLFLNRRGSARLILCNACGWQALCPHCDVALTYHHDTYVMRCHSCDFSDRVPTSCPSCDASELIFRSIGTKALESEINRLFPKARTSRFDRDTQKPERLSQQHEALQSGDIDILIGTQSIAKGFDLPQLAVVGIVQADSGLQIPDYTAAERTYQLLTQVAGRIGRGHRAGKLFVQTYEPASPLLALALEKDYEGFYQRELKQRELYSFPPYRFLLKITCARASSKSALLACQKLANSLNQAENRVTIEGPSPRFIEKVAGRYAWHLILKSTNRPDLVKIAVSLPSNYTYDLDPSDLL